MPERLDTESMPLTEPHPAPIFDTGPHPEPLAPLAADSEPDLPDLFAPTFTGWGDEAESPVGKAHQTDTDTAEPAPGPVAVPRVVVPSQFQYVKRWKFALLLLGVWCVAAAAGVGLYYWWFHSMDKTWPDFAVLLYVIVCMLAALLVSLAENRPMVSVTSIALMSAPFASAAATAAMYGMYVFGWIAP